LNPVPSRILAPTVAGYASVAGDVVGSISELASLSASEVPAASAFVPPSAKASAIAAASPPVESLAAPSLAPASSPAESLPEASLVTASFMGASRGKRRNDRRDRDGKRPASR